MENFIHAIGNEGTLLIPLLNFDFNDTKIFDANNPKSQMGVLTDEEDRPGIIRMGNSVYLFGVFGYAKNNFTNINNESAYESDSPCDIAQIKG